MTSVIDDRVFWIYFIVTLFFIILGLSMILSSGDPHAIILSVVWLISMVVLMVIVYDASRKWDPNRDDGSNQVCLLDSQSWCVTPSNKMWFVVNILFVLLLILSTVWAAELHNTESSPTGTISGVVILLGGLLLCGLTAGANGSALHINSTLTVPFWVAIVYLLLWLGLTLYITLNPQ